MIAKIMRFLEQNPIQILSTSVNSQPNSRPVGSATLMNERIYFCMNKDKNMFEELCANDKICLCVCASDYTWLRLRARVVFDESLKLKEEFIRLGKTRFTSADDENFKLFYLVDIQAELSQNGVKTRLD